MSGVIVFGGDVALPVTLKKDGATFIISPSATVKAAVVSMDREATLISESLLSISAAGADWPNSLVIAEFPSALSAAAVEIGDALLEIQVDDGGKQTWFVPVFIVRGSIS